MAKVNINNNAIQKHIHSEIVKEIRKGNLKNDHYITGWFYISIKRLLFRVMMFLVILYSIKKIRNITI